MLNSVYFIIAILFVFFDFSFYKSFNMLIDCHFNTTTDGKTYSEKWTARVIIKFVNMAETVSSFS